MDLQNSFGPQDAKTDSFTLSCKREGAEKGQSPEKKKKWDGVRQARPSSCLVTLAPAAGPIPLLQVIPPVSLGLEGSFANFTLRRTELANHHPSARADMFTRISG
jgi:hypothetical protein